MANHYKNTGCPNCSKIWSWDGEKCIRCGYILKLAYKIPEISKQILYFFKPKLYSPYKLYLNKNKIPYTSGIYGWYFSYYFDDFFCEFSESDCCFLKALTSGTNDKNWFLMYIGIAGEKTGRTLRDRIHEDHLNQNSEGSTFRQTLASLLYKKIKLDAPLQLNGEFEKNKLNKWIFANAMVTWRESDNPQKVEKSMLRNFGKHLPFNLQGNKSNPFKRELKKLRKIWRTAW